MDREERKIWERVMAGRETEPEQSLAALYAAARQETEDFRTLAQRLSGSRREQAEALAVEAREKAAALGGLLAMEGGRPDKGALPAHGSRERVDILLKRCYFRACRNCREYTSRMAQPEYGSVFRSLAQGEEGRCVRIARLLWEILP